MSLSDQSPGTPETSQERPGFAYSCSDGFVEILDRLAGSILISTYQAGRVIVLGASRGRLSLSLHSFDHAMGMAVAPDRIAVGSWSQIWLLEARSDIARQLEPTGQYDGCFVTRVSHVTGEIRIHELAWVGRELWYVNSLFSCLCSLDPAHSFLPRWRPPFITRLAAEDRCHLNGMAVADGRVLYATALGETDSADGWREQKASGGCLIDVPSGETVARGFALPHSPRIHQGRVWLLDSGRGLLVTVDPQSGRPQTVVELPGYPRGLTFADNYALVGLSRTRAGRGFEGMPLAQRRDQLTCGLAVVDLSIGRVVAFLEFTAGVYETFDVQFLPGIRSPAIGGPFPSRDGGLPIWIIPQAWMTGSS
jgi:uncharacterized protein (TIGR03032 family)